MFLNKLKLFGHLIILLIVVTNLLHENVMMPLKTLVQALMLLEFPSEEILLKDGFTKMEMFSEKETDKNMVGTLMLP